MGKIASIAKKSIVFIPARRGIRERDHSFYLVTLRRIFFYFGFKKTLARCKTTEKIHIVNDFAKSNLIQAVVIKLVNKQ